jgi:hypothetical protein
MTLTFFPAAATHGQPTGADHALDDTKVALLAAWLLLSQQQILNVALAVIADDDSDSDDDAPSGDALVRMLLDPYPAEHARFLPRYRETHTGPYSSFWECVLP